MKPEIKAAFCEALRSGRYKRTTGVLRHDCLSGSFFCASGVLCDLHAKAAGTKWVNGTYMNYDCRLPPAVRTWAGLGAESRLVLEDELPHTMERLNDDGLTFPEIANLIEQQW